MSDYFRIKKRPPSDEPIKYTINRDYLNTSIAEYEENLKKYNAKIVSVRYIRLLQSEKSNTGKMGEITQRTESSLKKT